MRTVGGSSSLGAGVVAVARAALSTSAVRRQLQRPERVTHAHGAGLADTMSQNPFSSYKPSARPADLQHTPAELGLNTSERDPYQRTLPNQPLQAPAPIVVAADEADVVSTAHLHEAAVPLGTWLARGGQLLLAYAEQHLKVALPAPAERAAASAVRTFLEKEAGAIIGEASTAGEVGLRVLEQAAKAIIACPVHLLARDAFLQELSRRQRSFLKSVSVEPESGADEALALAAHRLVAATIHSRNRLIDRTIGAVVGADAAFLQGGNAVWRLLLRAVEQHKAAVFGFDPALHFNNDDPWLTMYDWVVAHKRPMPRVTAPVALLLVATAVRLAEHEGSLHLQGATRRGTVLGGGAGADTAAADHIALVPHADRWKHARAGVEWLDTHPVRTRRLVDALRAHGFSDAAETVELRLAGERNRLERRRKDLSPVTALFANAAGAKAVFTKMKSTATDGIHSQQLPSLLRALRLEKVEQLETITEKSWAETHVERVLALLDDDAHLKWVTDTVFAAQQGTSAAEGICSPRGLALLQAAVTARLKEATALAARQQSMTAELKAPHRCDDTLAVLAAVGYDLGPLKQQGAKLALVGSPGNAVDLAASAVTFAADETVADAVAAVAARHPNWAGAGVLPTDPQALKPVDGLLRTAARIFIRLSYVPNATLALMKQRYRQRIGEVGTKDYQHNIPVELGKVEHYDTHLYKTYDPQGWYQRMHDIRNRNVSVKVDLKDLRTVDASGKAFFDLQTERRLRVLAGERVGKGVVLLDANRYEDIPDNEAFGVGKLHQLVADAKKAQLSKEYWPTVEVKVRQPSGQSRSLQSLIDYERVEQDSKALYEQYKTLKKRTLFVSPTDLYLRSAAASQEQKAAAASSEEGYVSSAAEIHADSGTPDGSA